jgi:hypothetical protein
VDLEKIKLFEIALNSPFQYSGFLGRRVFGILDALRIIAGLFPAN